MTQQTIQVGTSPNDGLGDPIRTAFIKTNDNFDQLYARAQSNPPDNPVGVPGDQAGMYAYDSTYFYYCFANYDGSSVIWAQVTQVGNVALPEIQNGNSNVAIHGTGGNITVAVHGVDNTVVFTTAGVDISGYLDVTGNITGGNIVTSNSISTSGDVISNNVFANIVSVTGTTVSGYFVGDGSGLTNTPINYGNANVALYLPTYSGTLAPLAIYTNGYYWANSVPVDFGGGGGGSTYGNANVAAYLPEYNGNIGATLTNGYQPFITDVGNLNGLSVAGLNAINLSPQAASVTIAPTYSGTVNINPSGIGSVDNMVIGADIPQDATFTNISAVGDVTGAFFIGDGSQLSNVVSINGDYTDANVAAFLPTYTGNLSSGNISVTGTVTVNGNVDVAGKVNGQLIGIVNNVNPAFGVWDFGWILPNTYTNPIQWIFALTPAGNVNMGTITAPTALSIDIGTIF
jgi:hypothetical protein